eukprot:1754435-Pyramimonas_sp.AAC.1
MMSPDTGGSVHTVNEETPACVIQSMVDNALKTWCHKIRCTVATPRPLIRTSPRGTLQAKVDQAIREEGSKWAPPDGPAASSDTAG